MRNHLIIYNFYYDLKIDCLIFPATTLNVTVNTGFHWFPAWLKSVDWHIDFPGKEPAETFYYLFPIPFSSGINCGGKGIGTSTLPPEQKRERKAKILVYNVMVEDQTNTGFHWFPAWLKSVD